MNQHNEHILLRYAHTRQTEQAQDAQSWQTSRAGRWRGAAAGTLGMLTLCAAILAAVVAIMG